MGFLGALFGGGQGAGFQAQSAPLLQSTNADQLNNAYNQTQNGISQQQAFLQALQAQGGLANQSNVFNQQQDLANQLALQAQGGGPNPALAQLNQATGQNVAQQGALMAGQRGAGANPALIARQASLQGAGIQQNAVGQAAVLRAQQQLAAQQALMGQQQNLGNMATQQVNQQASGLNSLNAATQGQQQNLLGAGSNLNNANVSNVASQNSSNAEIAKQNASKQGGILSSVGNAVGGALGIGGALLAHGGEVGNGPSSNVGKMLSQGGKVPGKAQYAGDTLKNDTVAAKLTPGEIVIPKSIAQGMDAPERAAAFVRAILAKNGKLK